MSFQRWVLNISTIALVLTNEYVFDNFLDWKLTFSLMIAGLIAPDIVLGLIPNKFQCPNCNESFFSDIPSVEFKCESCNIEFDLKSI